MKAAGRCPVPDDVLLDELGELAVNRSLALRTHAEGCASCQAERASIRELLGHLSSHPPDVGASQAFVARVTAAALTTPRGGPAPETHRRWSRPLLVTLTACAAAVTLFVSRSAWRNHGHALVPRNGVEDAPIGTIAARGHASREVPLAAEVLLLHDGRLGPVAGHGVRGADALAVRVTNLSGRTVHLMAFARDAAGEVHWLYPGYEDAHTNPTSVAIADGVKDRVLDEIVQPETPAAGPMWLVTLVSDNPLTVRDVEARLAHGAPESGVAALFPGVTAQEWAARWEPRP